MVADALMNYVKDVERLCWCLLLVMAQFGSFLDVPMTTSFVAWLDVGGIRREGVGWRGGGGRGVHGVS